MAVDDDAAEIRVGVQERLADPHQIPFGLLVQRHAGPEAGVNEQIIALAVGQREAAEERRVRRRQGVLKLPPQRRQIGAGAEMAEPVEAVTGQGRAAAVEQPGLAVLAMLDEPEHEILVIALQVDGLETRQRVVDQRVDHLERLAAAIHIIAEINHHQALAGMTDGVVGDRFVEFAQQIEAAVDVAHRVDSAARRHRRGVPRGNGVDRGREPFHGAIMTSTRRP